MKIKYRVIMSSKQIFTGLSWGFDLRIKMNFEYQIIMSFKNKLTHLAWGIYNKYKVILKVAKILGFCNLRLLHKLSSFVKT